jgi:hypothetical protein
MPQFPIGFAASPVQAHMANRAKQPKFSGIPGDYQTFCEDFELFWESLGGKTVSTKQMPKFVHHECYRVRANFHIKSSKMKWTKSIRCE